MVEEEEAEVEKPKFRHLHLCYCPGDCAIIKNEEVDAKNLHTLIPPPTAMSESRRVVASSVIDKAEVQ